MNNISRPTHDHDYATCIHHAYKGDAESDVNVHNLNNCD